MYKNTYEESYERKKNSKIFEQMYTLKNYYLGQVFLFKI